jgi:hypothetical protein
MDGGINHTKGDLLMFTSLFRRMMTVTMLALFSVTAALADEIVLTVNDTTDGRSVTFTMDDLLALPQTSFQTSTIWTDGVNTFSGPTLAAVLEAADMPFHNLRVSAINDYNVDFPAAEIKDATPILTVLINDAPFSVREKGPIWMLFPFDDNVALRTEDFFTLSVWQLIQIDVLAEGA